MIRHAKQHGFTLTELMMAMAFVSFILLFIVFAMLQVMGNYNKGLAIKQINQTSRTVVEELSRLARATSPSAINTSQVGNGRLCFGGVGYVWNVRGGNANKYTDNSAVTMVRVEDAAVCDAALPAINPAKAKVLVTSQVWVQEVTASVSSSNKLVSFGVKLSTAAENQPTVLGPSGYTCAGGTVGNFCAVASFNTTVSTRNGGQ